MKKVLLSLILGLAIAVGVVAYFVVYPNTSVKDDGIIYIRDNDTFDNVLDTLSRRGYLKNSYTFRVVAQLKSYPDLIKAGRYQIENGVNNNELVNKLRAGRQQPIKFTFNNLRTLDQLASLLSHQLSIDSTSFMNLLTDESYVSEFGFTTENFPAMFIPNTYQLYWNTSEKEFIQRMYKEYGKFWNENRLLRAKQAGLSPVQVIILASIVEEETVKAKEYPIIAGVYINRLKKRIPLAACPTIKYALGDFSLQRVLKKHMTIDSPYNTYKYRGLPPGPVRMPSIQVIESILDYQKHNYLYFCAKSDFSGEHHFSKTLREHNKRANEYHNALNKRKIFK